MSEETMVQHCSPTLAGIKTGNMFTCPFSDMEEVCDQMRYWNQVLGRKGLRVLPLYFYEDRVLVYVYRPLRLYRDLQHTTACRILEERGYGTETPERCVAQLVRRLKARGEFPHEIGLFLGYPPEDVCGFIEHHAADCKFAGCWKVYGDVEVARKLFAMYRKCTNIYCKKLAQGVSIDQLTVAGR